MVPMLAHAEFYTGNELLNKIQDQSHGQNMMALGFVAGAFDVGFGIIHCTPNTVNLGQIRDMFKNELLASPEKRHLSAESILNQMLKNKWPCRNIRNDI